MIFRRAGDEAPSPPMHPVLQKIFEPHLEAEFDYIS
jgi:hypothetical protein